MKSGRILGCLTGMLVISGCMTIFNAHHAVECRADSRDEMFQKARAVGVRPSRVTALP